MIAMVESDCDLQSYRRKLINPNITFNFSPTSSLDNDSDSNSRPTQRCLPLAAFRTFAMGLRERTCITNSRSTQSRTPQHSSQAADHCYQAKPTNHLIARSGSENHLTIRMQTLDKRLAQEIEMSKRHVGTSLHLN